MVSYVQQKTHLDVAALPEREEGVSRAASRVSSSVAELDAELLPQLDPRFGQVGHRVDQVVEAGTCCHGCSLSLASGGQK